MLTERIRTYESVLVGYRRFCYFPATGLPPSSIYTTNRCDSIARTEITMLVRQFGTVRISSNEGRNKERKRENRYRKNEYKDVRSYNTL